MCSHKFFRLSAFIITASLLGCAFPKYQERFVPFSGVSPSTSMEQAQAICEPQASMAGQRASDDKEARAASDRNRVTGYNCKSYGAVNGNTYGNNFSAYGNSTTNCNATTAGYGSNAYLGAINSMDDVIAPKVAYRKAREAALQSCMARQGWKYEKVCVQNCRR